MIFSFLCGKDPDFHQNMPRPLQTLSRNWPDSIRIGIFELWVENGLFEDLSMKFEALNMIFEDLNINLKYLWNREVFNKNN